MPERVVDDLEAIKIEEQKRYTLLPSAGAAQCDGYPISEESPVGQAGKSIEIG